jgi:hypothetical protein
MIEAGRSLCCRIDLLFFIDAQICFDCATGIPGWVYLFLTIPSHESRFTHQALRLTHFSIRSFFS